MKRFRDLRAHRYPDSQQSLDEVSAAFQLGANIGKMADKYSAIRKQSPETKRLTALGAAITGKRPNEEDPMRRAMATSQALGDHIASKMPMASDVSKSHFDAHKALALSMKHGLVKIRHNKSANTTSFTGSAGGERKLMAHIKDYKKLASKPKVSRDRTSRKYIAAITSGLEDTLKNTYGTQLKPSRSTIPVTEAVSQIQLIKMSGADPTKTRLALRYVQSGKPVPRVLMPDYVKFLKATGDSSALPTSTALTSIKQQAAQKNIDYLKHTRLARIDPATKGPDKLATITAINALKAKNGDVSKLMPKHQQLISAHLSRVGALAALPYSRATTILRQQQQQQQQQQEPPQ